MKYGNKHFDEAYFQRYYRGPKRVLYVEDAEVIADFLCLAYRLMGLGRIRTLIDIGAGPVNIWEEVWVRRHVEYVPTDLPTAASLHGSAELDISQSLPKWARLKRYSIVICQGVLQYIESDDLHTAVMNCKQLGDVIYFGGVACDGDRKLIDKARGEMDYHARAVSVYRDVMAYYNLHHMGFGLYVTKEVYDQQFAMER